MEIFSMGYALLSVQRALLDVVSPNLRAVVIDICKEPKLLYLGFYYDREASEKLIDLWQCAITEASADFDLDCVLDYGLERLDYPQPIPLRGRYAYLRKEGDFPFVTDFSKTCESVQREVIDYQKNIGIFIDPVFGKKFETNWAMIHEGKSGRHLVPAKPPSYKIEIFPVAYGLLAVQRAFLGKITPELSVIIVDVPKEDFLLYIHCYYDSQISSELLELWEIGITEAAADLGSGYRLDVGIHPVDDPKKIPFRGRYAYVRHGSRSS